MISGELKAQKYKQALSNKLELKTLLLFLICNFRFQISNNRVSLFQKQYFNILNTVNGVVG